MKKILSLIACLVISIALFQYRITYSEFGLRWPIKLTTWDALGYYMYLPGTFIYHDVTELKWFPDIDKKYHVSGGTMYQANKHKNGNYVFKYLGGVAIIEMPLFFIGHSIALITGQPADGFSAPYQYALGFGILLYVILSVFLLRRILLRYFSDQTTALTLLLVMLATNIIQYAAIDSAQSHGLIFPLYVLLLYFTIRWHEKPSALWASLAGLVIGIATISRPTEAVMLFIPFLWNTHTKEAAKEKWSAVRQNLSQVYLAIFFAFIGVLPQLIYWKISSGSFVYDVGSAWDFLTPHFRVLFGWEKGWFIYTPVTIFFIIGFFFLKNQPFRKSVIWFCLLNIYIIIAWRIWRYGGSYSTRALSQSYPVFALSLAALIEKINLTKWRYVFYAISIYLIGVNMFQIKQYNFTILHFDEMNWRYYGRIYLNDHPSPSDMSLLDTDEWVRNESRYHATNFFAVDTLQTLNILSQSLAIIAEKTLPSDISNKNTWLKIETRIKVEKGFDGSFLNSELRVNDSIKTNRIRLFSPISRNGYSNNYEFYVKVPYYFKNSRLKLYVSSRDDFAGNIEKIKVTILEK